MKMKLMVAVWTTTIVILLICYASMKIKGIRPALTFKNPRKTTDVPNSNDNSSYLIPKPINPGCLHRSSDLSAYKPIDTGVVYHHPPVVQYAKLSKNGKPVSLTFRDYMAIMSAYKSLQPDRIIIHTYSDMEGKYWNLIQKWKTNPQIKVEVSRVQRLSKIGGKRVKSIEHEADYIKLQGLLKFGGVTSDFDVIIVNGTKIKQIQQISECVLTIDGDAINIGFSSCIKNSSLVRKWLDSYHNDFQPNDWSYNSAGIPTKMLQAEVCYNVYVDATICVPRWSEAPAIWLVHNGLNWRSKTAAHYFSKHNYFKQDDESLLEKDNSFGEMLRYVNDA